MNIFSLGTLRNNRIENCPLASDKELLKQGRGSYDYRSSNGVIVVKWADTKCVLVGSTIYGINPTAPVRRYSKVEKRKSTLNAQK